jgi:predicted phosphodiesterase
VRVAALYDVHGNLPALDAVLTDVARGGADAVVVGGDVAAGPMPAEVLDRLTALAVPVHWVRGNADRELVAARGASHGAGEDPAARAAAWAAGRLRPTHVDLLAGLPATVTLDVDGLGPTCFCHGTPGDDEGILTRRTPDDVLLEALADVAQATVVGGHVHQRYDRRVAGRRMVNPGSVGMPYEGVAAAFWALLGPGVELRRTDYDLGAAVAAMRATGFPDLDDLVVGESLLRPADPEEVTAFFERARLSAR